MRIALIVNRHRDVGYQVASRVHSLLTKLGVTVVVPPDETHDFAKTHNIESASLTSCDVVMCLGGDGTMLHASSQMGSTSVPLIGIHLGSVGFLPEIECDALEKQLKLLVDGKYRIEKRLCLEVTTHDDEGKKHSRIALNDIAVTRGGSGRLISIEINFNGIFATRVRGDGIIVATPTGSTAYSLAAGGPVVHPSLKAFIVTPICPHSLGHRSMVVDSETRVQIKTISCRTDAAVAIDGEDWCELPPTELLEISKAERSLKLVRLGEDDFFERVSNKLTYFGGRK